jgi:D-threo-aldose 1-dehydrogenase
MVDPTQRVPLGRSAVAVSRLGFGTAPLGGLLRATPEEDARDAVAAALTHGLRYFDTAPQYGGGLSEQRLGAALKGVSRETFVISSKIGKLIHLTPDRDPPANAGFVGAPAHEVRYDYSYDGVLRSLEASFRRLGQERIDIALIHDVNRKYHGDRVMERLDEALDGACRALRRMRDEGVIGAFGPATNEIEVSRRFVAEADVDCIMLPQKFTLIDRSAAVDLLPECIERHVGVLIAGPFDSGILASGAIPGATYNYAPATDDILRLVSAMEAVCNRYNVPLRSAALQFPFQHPAVTSVVTGMRSRAEVRTNLAAFGDQIPDAVWSEIDALRAAPARG